MLNLKSFRITDWDKRYFAALFVVIGVIIFWRGVWDTLYEIPIMNNPYVSLFIGLAVITFSGVIFSEFDPLKARMERTLDILHTIVRHKGSKKKKYLLKYYDIIAKKHIEIPHDKIHKVERTYIIVEEKGKEIFIPIHRLEEIYDGRKIIWKKKDH